MYIDLNKSNLYYFLSSQQSFLPIDEKYFCKTDNKFYFSCEISETEMTTKNGSESDFISVPQIMLNSCMVAFFEFILDSNYKKQKIWQQKLKKHGICNAFYLFVDEGNLYEKWREFCENKLKKVAILWCTAHGINYKLEDKIYYANCITADINCELYNKKFRINEFSYLFHVNYFNKNSAEHYINKNIYEISNENHENDSNWLKIPKLEIDIINEKFYSDIVKDNSVIKKLKKAKGHKFHIILENNHLWHRWLEYVEKSAIEFGEKWCVKNDIEYTTYNFDSEGKILPQYEFTVMLENINSDRVGRQITK